MNSKKININLLKENPDNPRVINDKKLQELAESIRKFPQMLELRPLVYRPEDYVLLGGNMRLRAAKLAGMAEVDAIPADQLTPEQQREFVIKDNLSYGEWDWPKLVSDWPEIKDWGLAIPRIHLKKSEVEEDNFILPTKIKTDIKDGDFFEIGPHRLLCGSSTKMENMARLFKDAGPAKLVITDPPYNVDYEGGTGMKIENDKMKDTAFVDFLTDAFTCLREVCEPGAAIYIWHAESTGFEFRLAFRTAGWMHKQTLIWKKNSLVLGRQDYQWIHEPCIYGWRPGAAHYFTPERNHSTVFETEVDINKMTRKQLLEIAQAVKDLQFPTTVINCDKPSKNDLHPTMKPVKLIGETEENSSKPGDTVVDSFGGSGTTMVACHQLGRRAFLAELTPHFCQVIINRMRALDPNIKVTRNGKKYN